MLKKLSVIATILVMSTVCWSQREAPVKEKKEASTASEQQSFRASPAYAELLLRRTEVTSNLESLLIDYTDEFPKVKELRQTLVLLDRESARLAKMKSSDVGRLTLALGKLIVRKIELEVDVLNLMRNYKQEHPDVKRALRKVEIYESAIGEILN